jgi:hypothetical protein
MRPHALKPWPRLWPFAPLAPKRRHLRLVRAELFRRQRFAFGCRQEQLFLAFRAVEVLDDPSKLVGDLPADLGRRRKELAALTRPPQRQVGEFGARGMRASK